MVRRQPLGWVVAGLAGLCAGCLDGKSPWDRAATEAPTGPQASPADAHAATEPADPAGSTPNTSDAPGPREVEQQVNEFLQALARYDEPREPSRPVVPPPPTVRPAAPPPPDRSPSPETIGAGPPGVNTALAVDDAPVEAATSSAPPAVPVPPVIEAVTVRASPPSVDPELDDTQTVGVNTSLEPAPADSRETLAEMIERLRGHLVEHPNDTEAVWRLVLLELARGDDVRIQEYLQGVARETGDAIATTAEVMRSVREALSEPGPASDRALAAIQRLRHHFTRDAELLIPNVALCTRVSTFGVYDEMNPSALVPYRPNPVIVYCEIENFHSEQTADSLYRVTLSSRLEVLTADGASLWTHEEPDIEDRSRRRREDFFLAQLVSLPAELGPGDYVLKVMIEDTTAAKATEATHAFRIGPAAVSRADP
jgi:hypothetical protein